MRWGWKPESPSGIWMKMKKGYVSRKHIGLAPGKDALIINESGLYSLILKSRKPVAKAFKKWVPLDVLPAIRKDGIYIMGEERVVSGEHE